MTRDRSPHPRPGPGAGSRRGWGLTARTVVGVIALAGLLLAACSGPPSSGPEDRGDTVTSGATENTSTDASSETTPTDGSEVVVALVGVEVEMSNAVAPFDHHSNVDSLLLELGLHRARTQEIYDCLAREGFPPRQVSELPTRDDPILLANASFPFVEALARDGIPALPPTPESSDDFREYSTAEREASRACAEAVDGSGGKVIVALDLWVIVRFAWEPVLAEIDATDEIRSLVGEFSSCLRDEGIPAASATSETAYLSYVDFLLAETGGDWTEMLVIYERMGKLYAECGRELFEARERLRGGERREAFLREHEVAIRELSDLLYGGGGSP